MPEYSYEQEQEQKQNQCCSQENIVKYFQMIIAFVLLISLIPLIIGIQGLSKDGKSYIIKFNQIDWFGNQPYPLNLVYGMYILSSIILIIMNLILLFQINSLRVISNFIVFLLILGIILLAGFTYLGYQSLNKMTSVPNKETCLAYKDSIWPSTLYNNYQISQDEFCIFGKQCQCYIQNPKSFQNVNDNLNVNFNDSKKYDYTETYGQVISVFQCTNIYSHMYDPKAVIVINFFENTWNCSGLCEPIGYYIFSDINRGPPTFQQSCYTKAAQLINEQFVPLFYPTASVTGILIIYLVIYLFLKPVYINLLASVNNRINESVLSQIPHMIQVVSYQENDENSFSIINIQNKHKLSQLNQLNKSIETPNQNITYDVDNISSNQNENILHFQSQSKNNQIIPNEKHLYLTQPIPNNLRITKKELIDSSQQTQQLNDQL